MKLWLLRPVEGLPDNDTGNPWEPWYDKTFGFVVRAATEQHARQLAQSDAGNETYDEHYRETRTPWLEERYSTCVELTAEGSEEIIMSDQHWA